MSPLSKPKRDRYAKCPGGIDAPRCPSCDRPAPKSKSVIYYLIPAAVILLLLLVIARLL